MTWLREEDIKEKLSIGYINLLTAEAGCRLQLGDREADNIGIDCQIWGKRLRNKIDIQLKGTCTMIDKGEYFSYKLESKFKYEAGDNFIIVLVLFPKSINITDIVNFNKLDNNSVIMNARGYYFEYKSQQQTIRIPKTNLLCKESLKTLIQQSEEKNSLKKSL
ncbi:MAG: DUF4365 domain-containing protein [Fusobacteriaceae bacterium]